MAVPLRRLNFKKPITTRAGSKVVLYHVYDGYIHGAWYEEMEDKWYPSEWTFQGFYFPPVDNKHYKAALDLINNDYIEPETKKTTTPE